MHVIDLLNSNMFDVEVSGAKASISDVFPNWNAHDRFGVLIYDALGGLGATHLIQIAITSFYDSKPARRTERKVYPEIYAIHVGQWWGTHVPFDFWPARKEFLVSDDHREILDAINDRAITRLAVPQRPARDLVHRRKEEDAALDRIVTAAMYSATGRIGDPDFSIRGTDRRTETNPQRVLRPLQISEAQAAAVAKSGVPMKEGDPDYRAWLMQHEQDITIDQRAIAESNRLALRKDGLVTETYRFLRPADALKCL